MSFTPVTITGEFKQADGTPASGTFCATCSTLIVNGSEEQTMSPICALLDNEGNLINQSQEPFVLNALNDDGTTPLGAYYTFALALTGQGVIEFNAWLPNEPTTVTFEELYAARL